MNERNGLLLSFISVGLSAFAVGFSVATFLTTEWHWK